MAKESIFYSYTRHINGFAATLDDEVAAQIASEKSVSLVRFSSVRVSYMYIYIYNLSKCRASESGVHFPQQGKKITHNSFMGFPGT